MPALSFERRRRAIRLRGLVPLSRLLLGAGALIVVLFMFSNASAATASGPDVPAPDPSEQRPGGATTLAPGRRPGLASHFENLSLDERFDLSVGRAFFRDPWIAAPATTIARDGLGPLFNAHACVSCHPDGGRGVLDADGAPSTAVLLRLGRAARDGVEPDPTYGEQLQTLAIAPGTSDPDRRAVREGVAVVEYESVAGRYADGTAYELRRPTWSARDLAYGPLAADTHASARLAPTLLGAGLLDAIPEQTIVARADPDDRDGDSISGRASAVPIAGGGTALGRFGWKAVQPTVRQQVASALHEDVGITSELYPEQTCGDAQAACRAAPGGGDPPDGHEISARLLDELVRFTATLAVPARRQVKDARVAEGRALFHRLGCAGCHTPSFVTGASAIPQASGQTIWPYSDLLLHDMGPGLASAVGEGSTEPAEWRTAPLWGLGRATRDPARTSLLHDGRARGIDEAILWHGGEAQRARDGFVALPRPQRESLLAFLGTL